MSESEKFLRMFGLIFLSAGVLMICIGIGILYNSGDLIGGGVPLLIGVIFAAIGGGIFGAQLKRGAERKKILAEGTRFTGKIYGYVEDKSCTMNGDFLINIKVRYFDKRGIEREAVIPTGFTRGSGDFPIGATHFIPWRTTGVSSCSGLSLSGRLPCPFQ